MSQRRTNDILDEDLWKQVLDLEQSAFEEVVIRYQGAVSAVALSVLGDFAAAQDIAQETFWQAWKSRASLNDASRLSAWLCGIARNLSHQMLKQGKHFPNKTLELDIASNSSESDPVMASISKEERDLVWNTLESMPENYREVLVLYYREGQSIREVSRALSLTEESARQRLSRGREMVRHHLLAIVEGVLVRSRPGSSLTVRIMAGVAALSTAMKASTLAAASAGTSSTASQIAATATTTIAAKGATSLLASASTTASAGLIGGIAGAGIGLGGAWFGTWLPSQLAPTLSERRLLEKSGKLALILSVVLTLSIFVLIYLFAGTNNWYLYFLSFMAIMFLFMATVTILSLRTQRQVRELRKTVRPEDDPNPTRVKQLFEDWKIPYADNVSTIPKTIWIGKCWTSRGRLFGVPLVDVQFSDIGNSASPNPSRKAWGWIAFGDQATGILFAMGGIAKGGIALGGVAMGLFAFGGLAIGGLAIGGLGLGWIGIGGLGAGYDAIGGLAVGWHSAAGGGAIAYGTAAGGGAIAHEYAVGGFASAREANTDLAQEMARTQSYQSILKWYVDHRFFATMATVLVGLIPIPLVAFAYRRVSTIGDQINGLALEKSND